MKVLSNKFSYLEEEEEGGGGGEEGGGGGYEEKELKINKSSWIRTANKKQPKQVEE